MHILLAWLLLSGQRHAVSHGRVRRGILLHRRRSNSAAVYGACGIVLIRWCVSSDAVLRWSMATAERASGLYSVSHWILLQHDWGHGACAVYCWFVLSHWVISADGVPPGNVPSHHRRFQRFRLWRMHARVVLWFDGSDVTHWGVLRGVLLPQWGVCAQSRLRRHWWRCAQWGCVSSRLFLPRQHGDANCVRSWHIEPRTGRHLLGSVHRVHTRLLLRLVWLGGTHCWLRCRMVL